MVVTMTEKDARTLMVFLGFLAIITPLISVYLGAELWVRAVVILFVTIVPVGMFLAINVFVLSPQENTPKDQQSVPYEQNYFGYAKVVTVIFIVWVIAETTCFVFVQFSCPARIEGPYFAGFDVYNYPRELEVNTKTVVPIPEHEDQMNQNSEKQPMQPYEQLFVESGKTGAHTYHRPIQQFRDIMGEKEFSKLKWFGTLGFAPIDGSHNFVSPPEQENQLFFRIHKAFFVRYLVVEDIEVELVAALRTPPPDGPIPYAKVASAPEMPEKNEIKDIVECFYIVRLNSLFPPNFGVPVNVKEPPMCRSHYYSRDGLFYKVGTPSGGFVLSNSPFASISVMFECSSDEIPGTGVFFLLNVYVLVSNGKQSKRVLVTKEPFWIGFEEQYLMD